MIYPRSFTAVGVHGTDVTLLGRIDGNLGIPITIASLASIVITVQDTTTGIVTLLVCTIAQSVTDNLIQNQQDPRWQVDSPAYPSQQDRLNGYNFSYTVPGAYLPNAVPYIVLATFNFVGGATVVAQWNVTMQ